MDYKEEILSALSEVCRKARKEGYQAGLVDGALQKSVEKTPENKCATCKHSGDSNLFCARCVDSSEYERRDCNSCFYSYDWNGKQRCMILRNGGSCVGYSSWRLDSQKHPELSDVKVGDEVYSESTQTVGLVYKITDYNSLECLNAFGGHFVITERVYVQYWKKTGRHFDLDEIFEEMRTFNL